MFALRNKNGGIQPIAVGLILKRLGIQNCQLIGTDRLSPLLSPCQVSVGVMGGTELMIHAAETFVASACTL